MRVTSRPSRARAPCPPAARENAATELGGFVGEARNQAGLALPVSLSMVCNRVMSLTSVAFVGRLGPVPLAAAALATTLGNVTGNSIMVGLASAVSTLGGRRSARVRIRHWVSCCRGQ